jgi:crotonobetainyl-CoA:carnitine CoA-transferase CaiB-like acyl-CoA transferase
MRQVPPFVRDESAYFLSVNRSKRSLGLDLKRRGATDVFSDLVRASDVLIEGFRPGRVDRLGIGPEHMRAVNRRLVYCSVSGFGQSGPDRARSGHDLTYVARSGILSLNAPDRSAEAPPIQMADLAAGIAAACAISAALFERERTGEGAFLDLSILDVMASWLGVHAQAARAGLAGGELMGTYPFYAMYTTSDGRQVALAALEPAFWSRFCRAVDRPDLEGQQFAQGAARERLFAALEAVFAAQSAGEWHALISRYDLAAEVVASVAEAASDPHLLARGVLFELQHPTEGTLIQVATAPGLSGDGVASRATPPPGLGADTRAVLDDVLGYGAEKVESLIESGVVFEHASLGRRIAPGQLP